jgi:hypothetical protein
MGNNDPTDDTDPTVSLTRPRAGGAAEHPAHGGRTTEETPEVTPCR